MTAIIPVPRANIAIRPATMGDYAFIDRLQDMHSKALGFMPKAQLEGKIAAGHVLVAEERNDEVGTMNDERNAAAGSSATSSFIVHPSSFRPIGYCMSQDRYFKRDDVGIIYQMNVVPGKQRSLVGATLVRAVFERAAYGCRLFCCWCAQDLDANWFWESLGFVPLAFRAGAKGHGRRPQARAHIFWQRRIREGDCETPYWYPAKTDGGMMREDRLVLPIPPGVRWNDPMPMLLPTAGVPEAQRALPAPERKAKPEKIPTLMPPTRRGARFGPPPANDIPQPIVEKAKPEKKKREKVKADPVLVAKARELRDRYLERVNAPGGASLILPAGKYEVARSLEAPRQPEPPRQPLLPNAA